MFQASDLKKVKSVKRDNGTDWAYYDEGLENKFKLNFSSTQVKGGRELMPGDVILLFQKVDHIPDVRPHTYMTHLVTPVDNVMQQNPAIEHRWNWEREVAVIARAEPRTAIYSTPRVLSFHKPNWGKVCDVQLLNSERDVVSIQNDIWTYFLPFMNPNFEAQLTSPDIVGNEIIIDLGVTEGAEINYIKQHIGHERNPIIVGLAKSRAFAANNGRVLCSCCDFDFLAMYGEHGQFFIEAHHILPIGAGVERKTRVDDLALVCSNCHRMLHRKNKATNSYFSVQELRQHIRHLQNR
ncbi:MAG TPA: HNH endonuclease [Mucilaginibacter sp.]|nr:HNH endonuclease [Mucilaginibacter sp.]